MVKVQSPKYDSTLFHTDPAEADAFYESQVAWIRAKHPEFRGAISIETSVNEQMALLEKMTVEQTGQFLHSTGKDANGPEGE